MKMKTPALGLVIAVLIPTAVGCIGGDESSHSESVVAAQQAGRSFNGRSFNGRSFNGRSFNGRSFNGGSLNGSKVVNVRADKTVLYGTDANNLLLAPLDSDSPVGNPSGYDFVGARFPATLDDGTPVELEIDRIENGGSYDHGEVLLHHVWVLTSPNVRHALCHNDAMAVPIPGYWQTDTGVYVNDPNFVTFACVNAAIGKCTLMGFDPSVVAQEANHQTCVRAMRGDYCGTGEAYTEDGQPVNIWDRNQSMEADEANWSVDAEWSPEGAVCLAPEGKQRWQHTVAEKGPEALPPCLGHAYQGSAQDGGSFEITWNETMFRAGCGQTENLSPATLIVTEHNYTEEDPNDLFEEVVETVKGFKDNGASPDVPIDNNALDTICARGGFCFTDAK